MLGLSKLLKQLRKLIMAFATVYLERGGLIKEAPVGFSWTTLFFGFFPSLIRGDGKWALIIIVCAVFSLGLANIVFAFIYNRLYITSLIEIGYKVKKYYGDKAQIEATLSLKLKK